MAHELIVVKAAHDPEAGVWFVESSDLPGLNVEAASIEALIEKLPAAIADLAEAGGFDDDDSDGDDGRDVPVELIAHASTRVRLRANA